MTATLAPATTDGDHTPAGRLTRNLERSEAQAVPKSTAPPRQARPGVRGPGPMRWHQRLAHNRYRVRIPIRQPVHDATANLAHYAVLGPLWYAPRAIARRADWTAVPIALTVAAFWLGIPLTVALVPALGWVGWYAWLNWDIRRNDNRHLPPPLAKVRNARVIRREQKQLDAEVQPRIEIFDRQARPHVVKLFARIPASYTNDDLDRLPGMVSNAYKQRISMTFPNPGIVVIHRHLADPLALEPARPHLLRVEDGKIPFGIDFDGDPMTLRLHGHSIVIAGRKGSGKTTRFASVLAYTIRLPYRDIRIIDPKKGMDLSWAWPWCSRVATDKASALVLLEEMLVELDQRTALLRGQPLPPMGPGLPLVVLFIDEMARLLEPRTDPDSKRIEYLIATINANGRAPGFTTVAATQDLRKTIVSGQILAQTTHILGLAVNTNDDSEVLMPGAARAGYDLSKIPLDRPGQGVWRGDNPRFIPCRAYGLYGQALDDEVSDLYSTCPNSPQKAPTNDRAVTPQPVPEDVPQRTTGTDPPTTNQLREWTSDKLKAAGPLGVRLKDLADDFGVPDHRVKSALGWLRKRGFARCDSTRWYWTGQP